MLIAPTSPAAMDARTREAFNRVARHVAVVQGNSKSTRRITRKFMAKQNVTPEYYEALQKFAERLETDQQKSIDEKGQANTVVKVVVETGRKFDKVLLATIRRDAKAPAPKVMYFVDRSNGAIYGPKSPLAPNLKWYFGVVENADKWDWSGEQGRNVADDTVEEVGGYGAYKHYEPKTQSAAVSS